MRKLLLPAFCLLCLAGCNDNAEIADFESVENSSAAASRYSNLDYIRQRIGMNAQTRGSDQASIEPYIYEGDTVMYIVNYEDGWELLSNDTSVPMVVAHADTGEFIKDSLPQSMSVYFDNVAKNLFDRNTAGIANSDLNGEWCMFASSGVPSVPVFPEDTIIINTQDTLFSDFECDYYIWEGLYWFCVAAMNEKGFMTSPWKKVVIDPDAIASISNPSRDETTEIYDLSGQKRNTLLPGINIIRKDGVVKKEMQTNNININC